MTRGPSLRQWRSPSSLCVLCLLLLLLLSLTAWADPQTERYSDYEQETLDLALERRHAAVDPHPEGKRIVAIDIEVLDVIEERDPAPNFLNWFHANSRDHVIRRELLFDVGKRYDSDSVGESERNLRALRQESLVIIAPLTTGDPDTVRVLVVAKDIWSLRLNSDYVFKNGQLEYLLLQPAEENLAGTHRRVLANFVYEPDTVSFGARFTDPRLAGSRHQWTLDGNVIVNHLTGDPEGTYGTFLYGEPLYSTRQKWAWGSSVQWHKEVTRSHIGTQLACWLPDESRAPCAALAGRADAIPIEYDTEIIGGRVSVTRSFGYAVKNDLTAGVDFDRSVFRTPELSAQDPVALEQFVANRLPRSETRNGPYFQYHVYLNQFESLLDVETMALQESYLTGPELYVRLYPVAQIFGSNRDFMGLSAGVAHTQRLGSGFVRPYLASTIEVDVSDGPASISDSKVQTGLRVVTPSFYVGRLIYDGTLLYRPDNYSNYLVEIGGDGRLRGYPSGLFQGENLIASNLEFRSRALQLWTVLVRGALFYDVADVFFDTDLDPKQGVGFGLRVLFPQLGRSVMRVDWGFAITPGVGIASPFEGLLLTFKQAFGVPDLTGTGVNLDVR